eukprot:RCo042757
MALFFVLLVALALECRSALVLEQVLRKVDLTSAITRHTAEITFVPSKDRTFFHALPVTNVSRLAFLSARQGDTSLSVTSAEPKEFSLRKDVRFFQITLAHDLKDHPTVTLVQDFFNTVTPLPREIARQENQFVLFQDDLYFLTPYPVQTQTTVLLLPSSKVESLGPISELVKRNANNITCGPFADVNPGEELPGHVHYLFNGPILRADTLKRTLQVSAWGVLSVEESYELVDCGAALRGSFSRFEYQRFESPAVVPFVTALLSRGVTDLYFRDDIGNISTSVVREGELGTVEVDLRPRFPLFGGWRTDFYFGYNQPLSQATVGDGAIFFTPTYTMTFPLPSPIKDLHVASLQTTVILPERASVVEVTLGGKPIPGLHSGSTVTYLDTAGRPTLSFTVENIVSAREDRVLVVKFTFSKLSMLREPLLLTAIFLALFFISTVYVRL